MGRQFQHLGFVELGCMCACPYVCMFVYVCMYVRVYVYLHGFLNSRLVI